MLFHANSLYQEEIKVPLIFWMPGEVPAGQRVSSPVTNAALPATIMDLLGDQTQPRFQGPSLASLWNTESLPSTGPNPLAEMKAWSWEIGQGEEPSPARLGDIQAVFSPDWHYIEHSVLCPELYNWVNDPEESENLAHTLEGQAVIEGLKKTAQIDDTLRTWSEFPTSPPCDGN